MIIARPSLQADRALTTTSLPVGIRSNGFGPVDFLIPKTHAIRQRWQTDEIWKMFHVEHRLAEQKSQQERFYWLAQLERDLCVFHVERLK